MDEAEHDVNLASLGVGVAAERVLRWLLQAQCGSRAAMARQLRLHPTQVSRAVDELEERGLVWTVPDRGAAVHLAAAGPAMRSYAQSLRADADARVLAVERLAEALDGRGERPQLGTHWVEPEERTDEQSRQRHHTHWPRCDFRAIVPPTVWWIGPLLMLRPPPDGPPLRVLLSHGGRHEICRLPAHTQVRRHQDALPAVLIVDGERAAVQVVHRGAHAYGWTTDPAQVGLLGAAFETYWSQAG
ncbi:hypothetical protein BH20ACT6_BH20ACT6_18680 [soil metagenome]